MHRELQKCRYLWAPGFRLRLGACACRPPSVSSPLRTWPGPGSQTKLLQFPRAHHPTPPWTGERLGVGHRVRVGRGAWGTMQRWEVVAGDGDWSRGAAENLPQEGKELAGGLRVSPRRMLCWSIRLHLQEHKFRDKISRILKDFQRQVTTKHETLSAGPSEHRCLWDGISYTRVKPGLVLRNHVYFLKRNYSTPLVKSVGSSVALAN